VTTPVLFIVFNRPDVTKRVFEAIRQAKPPRLYIAADGPREGRAGEAEKVADVRRIATAVDWDCEVKTLFREKNLGCKRAVSSAIDWFFEHEEQGIILEDDCLPAQSFFRFCDVLLDHYHDDSRVWQVCGTTHLSDHAPPNNADYFFSRYGPIWGWASWRRAWENYDVELAKWQTMRQPNLMESVYPDANERAAKLRIGDRLVSGEIDTWDWQWGIAKNFNNALSIVPKKNQIVNIGFTDDATHTHNASKRPPARSFEMGSEIVHPEFVVPDRQYERAYAKRHWRKPSFPVRVSRAIRRRIG